MLLSEPRARPCWGWCSWEGCSWVNRGKKRVGGRQGELLRPFLPRSRGAGEMSVS